MYDGVKRKQTDKKNKKQLGHYRDYVPRCGSAWHTCPPGKVSENAISLPQTLNEMVLQRRTRP